MSEQRAGRIDGAHSCKLPLILSRYVLLESLQYFFISLLTFTGLLLTMRILRFASLIINKGVALSQIAKVFISIIPTFLEFALPMSALLGIMLAFARLSGDSEIVVIRASGISLRQLILPVAVFGALCGVAALYVSLTLKPLGYQSLSKSLFEIARSSSTAGLGSGIFNELGDITLYSDAIEHKTGNLEKVLIDDRRDEQARKIIFAQSGRITSKETEQLLVISLSDGQIHEIVDQKYILTNFSQNQIHLALDEMFPVQKIKSNDERRARELFTPDLRSQIERTRLLANQAQEKEKEQGEAAEEESLALESFIPGAKPKQTLESLTKRLRSLKVELARRYSMPFAAFILALVAMPLGIQPSRTQKTWGAGLSAAVGMLVFVSYYGLLTFGIALAEGGTIHPVLGVWIPNLVCIAIATVTLSKMSSEEWQSVTHIIEIAATKVQNLFSRGGRSQ